MRRAAVVALLVVAACSSDPVPDGSDATDARPGGGPGGEFVVIETSGGLIPPGALFSELPEVAVYADGTVVVPGPVNGIFPGPAVQPLLTGHLDGAAIDELVQAAATAGLLGDKAVELDVPEAQVIADGPTTSILVVTNGERHEVTAYALGLVEPEQGDRAAAAAFVQAVERAADGVVGDDGYDPTAYAVLASAPYDAGAAGVEPNTLRWPAGLPALAVDGCVVVDGAGADELEAALRDATQITRWEQGADTFALSIRPLLPHEDSCEG